MTNTIGALDLDDSVLVVDDEPQVVWILQRSLEAEGYRTLSARDGVAALETVDLFHPKLMLLDIMMPALDGWSVLEELSKLPSEERPRVIVVSALTSLRDEVRAAELGADAFCPKPFDVDDLLRVMRGLEDLGAAAPSSGMRDPVSGARTRAPHLEASPWIEGQGLILRGKVDRANVAAFRALLQEEASKVQDVLLEVRDLNFNDGSGLFEVLRIACARRGRGRVVLQDPEASVRLALDHLDRTANVDCRLSRR